MFWRWLKTRENARLSRPRSPPGFPRDDGGDGGGDPSRVHDEYRPEPLSSQQREEAFYRSLDGNAEIEDLLECDRLAEEQELLESDRLSEEQRIADLRRQLDMEQQRTDALSREQSAHNWAEYMEAGSRQIAVEAVRHARVHDTDFYYQLVKWVSRLEAEALVDHAGMERANAREQRALSHL